MPIALSPTEVSTANIALSASAPVSPLPSRGEPDGRATPPATVKPYHHGDLRTALVIAGLELLETGGLAALTLRAVAARIGVSHTAPKNHFAGIRALRTAIATEGFWRLAQAMKDGLRRGATPADGLRFACEGYTGFAADHSALFQLMFSPILCDPADAALAEAAGAIRLVLQEVSDGTARGDCMLLSLLHGYAALSVAGRIERSGDGVPIHGIAEILPDLRRPT